QPFSPQASTGTTSLFTVQGNDSGTTSGDYVTEDGALNTFHRYFIEVPPGLGRLTVEIFDADVGDGGANEDTAGRDRDRGGYNTTATYTLIDPGGTTRATLTGDDNSPNNSDNAWVTLLTGTNATSTAAGHWELRVSMGDGDDINAFGIRAHDGTSGSGGTELNVYADSMLGIGTNPPDSGTMSRSYTFYPYITSGCNCAKNDFDYDSDEGNTGSMSFTRRGGGFTQNYASTSLSADNVWRRDTFSGWTTDQNAIGYGIWSSTFSITSYVNGSGQNGNYTTFYLSNFQAAANPPTANPAANSFRIYLPNDAGTAPVKPYLEQLLTYASFGPNPPQVGQTTRFSVTVRLVNPTAQAITFSAANLVTANVPGAGATYAGSAAVSQGTITAQPTVGNTGNITWNPGTVAAGATVLLTYKVNVAPTSAGQRIPVTATPASGNGTRAQFRDETGNTTQARALAALGPLCELATTVNVITAIELASFTAKAYDGGVSLQWETGFEVDNLGFKLYRDEGGRRVPVTKQIVAGSALEVGFGTALGAGRAYNWWDGDAAGGSYWLEEIDTRGKSIWHGPVTAKYVGGDAPTINRATLLSDAGRVQSTSISSAQLERKASIPVPMPQSLSTQATIASNSAIKLSVRREGWYRVTQPELVAAGFDPNTDPQLLQMFVDGKQLPIKVNASKGNQFDSLSSVEFYGLALDSAVTDSRVYWLVAGSEPGLRIQQANSTGLNSSARSFLYTVERKDRTLFFFSLKNGEKENFFGATVSTTPVDQSLTLQHLDEFPGTTAMVEVALQGATLLTHSVRVQLNGMDIGTLSFDEQAEAVAKFNVPQSLLREGANQVTLTAQGGESDFSFVDYIRISYWHNFMADGDRLRLTAPGKQKVTVGGFTSNSIKVMDITDLNSVQELRTEVVQQASGFVVKATPTGSGQRTLLAFANAQANSPAALWLNYPSSLRSNNNGADLIIIAHKDLFTATEPLMALRQGEGLSTRTVYVEDVYDEFSYGQKSPQAIRDFLAFARSNWSTAPRFALLVGSASRDPKNYIGFGDSDLVPTKIIDTAKMETASDEWFADFGNNGLADIHIGRLPARNAEQLSAMIFKIITYQRSIPSSEAALYADSNSDFDFEAASASLRSLIPPNINVEQINRGETDAATARRRLFKALQRGQKVVNYIGHGSATIWNDFVLTSDDAASISSNKHLPMFVMMTCLNGYFLDSGAYSLAEALMRADRAGAISVWASSGMTASADQLAMNQEFIRLVFSDLNQQITLGEAIAGAKAVSNDLDVRRTWVLFGDPTMKLR
ncbi:MAG TPA: C25 family cysteine peptidase, partial [Blastocatellia bacterium]|nr:C25 family cysteine peptidase [Blastocatellia bacterium]